MEHFLHNPVFNALISGDKNLNVGDDTVKYFDEAVSPFVGFEETYTNGFVDLHEMLPAGRRILYATPGNISEPQGWELRHEIKGLQFIYEGGTETEEEFHNIIPLNSSHVNQMIELATLTKPGPFGPRTIDFGHYNGIFDKDKLVAMTGQRLHVQNFTEISAVCTHPDYTGKGYAYTLLKQQLQIILQLQQRPFLHVRADNERAIALYEWMGFTISRPMNFYFMKRQ